MRPLRRPSRRSRVGRRAAPQQPAGRVRLILWSAAIAATVALTAAGGLLTDIGPWYRNLRKPSWQPPDWLFGPAWTIILGLSCWAFVLAWQGAPDAGGRARVAVLFGINWVLHLLWSPLFFKWHRPDWALMEVPLLWLSVLAMAVGYAPFASAAPLMLLPYLLWVAFAAYLNLTIVRLNGPFGRAAIEG